MIEGMEWIVLLAIILVLLFLVPAKVPALARGLGQAWGEFRSALKRSKSGQAQINRELAEATRRT